MLKFLMDEWRATYSPGLHGLPLSNSISAHGINGLENHWVSQRQIRTIEETHCSQAQSRRGKK
jgi:hypothetical protein